MNWLWVVLVVCIIAAFLLAASLGYLGWFVLTLGLVIAFCCLGDRWKALVVFLPLSWIVLAAAVTTDLLIWFK